jgi:sulfite exporter TauE/SafE
MYPAAEQSYSAAALVALVFGAATLLAMTGCVFVLRQGVSALRWRRLDRYSHALAGLAITACGVAVKLGL